MQAKTRAVKVLRQAIAHKGLAITHDMLRGHSGAMHPAHVLEDVLASRTEPLPHDSSKRVCLHFPLLSLCHAEPSVYASKIWVWCVWG
jgi:hypothetical protein